MHFLRLSTLLALVVSVSVVAAATVTGLDSSATDPSLAKRGRSCRSESHISNGRCVVNANEYPLCERTCIDKPGLPCDKADRNYFNVVAHTTLVSTSPGKKSWKIAGMETDISGQTFLGNIDRDGNLDLHATCANDEALHWKFRGRQYWFELTVGQWKYYYHTRGFSDCTSWGPQDLDLFTELTTVAVVAKKP
jgi:hypothetical protein